MSNRGQFTTDRQPANRGGRKRGTPNKVTTALREAILEAGERAGGKEGMTGYLQWLARTNSSAFAGLLGKVLPTTIEGAGENGEHAVNVVTWNVVDPRHSESVPPAPEAGAQ
jgi:hypothetical protein